jgi:hypothetical protein
MGHRGHEGGLETWVGHLVQNGNDIENEIRSEPRIGFSSEPSLSLLARIPQGDRRLRVKGLAHRRGLDGLSLIWHGSTAWYTLDPAVPSPSFYTMRPAREWRDGSTVLP